MSEITLAKERLWESVSSRDVVLDLRRIPLPLPSRHKKTRFPDSHHSAEVFGQCTVSTVNTPTQTGSYLPTAPCALSFCSGGEQGAEHW